MLHFSEWSLVGRMALATLLGYLIGFEREWRGKPAGERTFALIGLGAAAFTSIGAAESVTGATRVIQGVVAGVGFLGAGLIFREASGGVMGLTTAASSWAVAAVGVLVGAGAYVTAAAATALVLFILEINRLPILRRIERGRRRPDRRSDGGVPDEGG